MLCLLGAVLFFLGGCGGEVTMPEARTAFNAGDFAKAAKGFAPRAVNGDAEAQFRMGVMAELGLGRPQDYNEAVKWFTLSAEKKYRAAEYHLGVIFDRGLGVNKDPVAAADWFRRAADKGDARAQFNLAMMYLDGEGISQDLQKALELFERAAELGLPEAQYKFGELLMVRTETDRKLPQPLMWFRKAADQGHSGALYRLGKMHVQGAGLPVDLIEAHVCLSLAVKQSGDGYISSVELDEARALAQNLEKQMRPEEIAQSESRAKIWVSKSPKTPLFE